MPYSGGVVSSILASRAELMQAGHDVNIITLDFLGDKHGYEPGIMRIACPVKFTYKSNPMAVPWNPDRQVKQIISKFNPDIIHSHHPFLLGSSAGKAARSLGIPIVFTYHSVYETLSHNVPLPQNITQFAIKKLVKQYCGTVDCIIAPTQSIKNHIRSQNIVTPIEIIPSGLQPVYLNLIKPVKEKKESERFKLLVVTRFAFEKMFVFCWIFLRI
ncbi:MAG TPA: glycosyltransferase [Candidatus Babeliales bacterium]|nr:glycosyltransferase [Candidatus Babeliales bacterium]